MNRTARPEEDYAADPLGIARLARVISVDRGAGTCVVALGDPDDDDGEVESPNLPWLPPRAGSLRIWAPPAVDEQVLVICPEGDLAQGLVLGGLWSGLFGAPSAIDGLVAVFGDDGRFEYDSDAHACTIDLPAGATLTVTADGGIALTGDVTIDGDVTVTGKVTASDDVIGGGKSLKTHRHTNVQAGGAVSGPPQ